MEIVDKVATRDTGKKKPYQSRGWEGRVDRQRMVEVGARSGVGSWSEGSIDEVELGSNRLCDANLVITQSHNSHTKTPILRKSSKSGLIGVWHKDNMYLSTNTIEKGNPHPRNIDSRTKNIRITLQRQLFSDKLFFSSLENHGREIISPTHTHTKCGKQEVLLI